ncbi:MAG: hypothetical protein LPK45_07555 [Bacteroidota bacterium]|nr:hypothetical protein [Bacteroidota bacterium]MDX5430928.1 hypothetical protein [Bacteroidota bacterium]MDX5469676.1 hypothetical protein [Bacteroidota bacterium]
MIKRKLLIALLFMLSSTFIQAQESDVKPIKPIRPGLSLGVSVPHLFLGGLKLDAQVPLGKKWILYASPEGYVGGNASAKNGKVQGYGAQGGLRFVFWQEQEGTTLSRAFIQLSGTYQNFHYDLVDKVWVEEVQNGQNVLVKKDAPVTKDYQRTSYDYLMGMIWNKPSGFYAEFNFGFSVRQVERSYTENYYPTFLNDEFAWSFGYEGIAPTIGFRMGYTFLKGR